MLTGQSKQPAEVAIVVKQDAQEDVKICKLDLDSLDESISEGDRKIDA